MLSESTINLLRELSETLTNAAGLLNEAVESLIDDLNPDVDELYDSDEEYDLDEESEEIEEGKANENIRTFKSITE